MAGFRITQFRGIRPRISALKLPEGEAQISSNTKLGSGDLESWTQPDFGVPVQREFFNRTIYRYDNDGSPVWFEWDDVVSVAPGSVKGDTLERTYYTGDGFPKMTYRTIATAGSAPYPTAYRRLGIAAPSVAPTVFGPEAPEAVPPDDRRTTPGSMITKLFEIVFVNWTIHPGSGSPTAVWNLGSAAMGDIVFDMNVGDTLRVLEVLDEDTIRVGSDTGTGAVAITRKNDQTSINFWKPFDSVGSTQEADFTGWRLPDGVQVEIPGHLLRVGDVIRVTRLDYSDGLIFANTASVDFYEQNWVAEADVTIGGITFKQTSKAIVGASADATTDFANLEGGFYYDVVRSESTGDVLQDRSYVYTFVSALGEESPPSPPSEILAAFDGDTVSVEGLEQPPLNNYDITAMRIYRTNASEAGTEFQFVKEFNVATGTVEGVKGVNLGEVISSTTYDPPPEGLQGITAMPNGMLVGFVGQNIHFSEPFFPHAWPAQYDQAIDYNCVALAPFGNSIAILTEGVPYILTAAHPRNANIRPYKINQACVSALSVATDADRVVYASPDGLIELSVNGAEIITEDYVKLSEWSAFVPESIVGEFHDGKYIAFFDGEDNVPQAPASVFITGTVNEEFELVDEAEIVAGTETIILTLVSDTWAVAAGGLFDAERQGIIDGLTSNLDFPTGWNQQRANIPVTDVVRTDDEIVTITLSALPAYSLIANESISLILPITATASGLALIGDVAFTLFATADYSSTAIAFSEFDNSGTDIPVSVSSEVDIVDWDTYSGVGTDTNHEATFRGAAYAASLNRWLAVGFRSNAAPIAPDIPVFSTSEDNGITWTERFGVYVANTDKQPWSAIWYPEHDTYVVVGDNTSIQTSPDGIAWRTASVAAAIPATESLRNLVIASGALSGGEFLYASCATANFLIRSRNLVTRPPHYTWKASTIAYVSATGTKLMATGAGKIVSIGNFATDMEIATTLHGDLSGSSVGAISSYDCQGIAFGDDLWVAVSDDFRIVTCASGSEGTIGNWSSPSVSKDGNTTIKGVVYDDGDGGLKPGYGFIAFGINDSSGLGTIWTSTDAATWTLRKTLIEPVALEAMAVSFPERQLGLALQDFAPSFNGAQAPTIIAESTGFFRATGFLPPNFEASSNTRTDLTVRFTGSDVILKSQGFVFGAGNIIDSSIKPAATDIFNLNTTCDSVRITVAGNIGVGSNDVPGESGGIDFAPSFRDGSGGGSRNQFTNDLFFTPVQDREYGFAAVGQCLAQAISGPGGIDAVQIRSDREITVAFTFRKEGFNDLQLSYTVKSNARAIATDLN